MCRQDVHKFQKWGSRGGADDRKCRQTCKLQLDLGPSVAPLSMAIEVAILEANREYFPQEMQLRGRKFKVSEVLEEYSLQLINIIQIPP